MLCTYESDHGSEMKLMIFDLDDSSRVSLLYILKDEILTNIDIQNI